MGRTGRNLVIYRTGIVPKGVLELLAECDGVVLESNHCPEMLENGLTRVAEKEDTLETGSPLQYCGCIMHPGTGKGRAPDHPRTLKRDENTPEKALLSAREGLGLFYQDTKVTVATQAGTSSDKPEYINIE